MTIVRCSVREKTGRSLSRLFVAPRASRFSSALKCKPPGSLERPGGHFPLRRWQTVTRNEPPLQGAHGRDLCNAAQRCAGRTGSSIGQSTILSTLEMWVRSPSGSRRFLRPAMMTDRARATTPKRLPNHDQRCGDACRHRELSLISAAVTVPPAASPPSGRDSSRIGRICHVADNLP
jgi:hypothetical protein